MCGNGGKGRHVSVALPTLAVEAVCVLPYCRKKAVEVEVCSVRKGGGSKAARAGGRRTSSGSRQPSIADMFSRE